MLLRKFTFMTLVAMAIGGFTALTASNANAQATAGPATANINALINNPITLAKTADLDFGSAAPSTAATTIIVDPTTGAQTGSAIGLGGATTAAGFTVTGLANQAFSVTLPADGTVTLAGPGAPMAVNTFLDDAPATITAGSVSFGVGATLTVGANQTAGGYTGTFDVTVSYQ